MQAKSAEFRVADDSENFHLGERCSGVFDRCHRGVPGELRRVMNAEVDGVADFDVQLLGQAFVDELNG